MTITPHQLAALRSAKERHDNSPVHVCDRTRMELERSLFQHADALLAAAEENARLREAIVEAVHDISAMPVDSPYQPGRIRASLAAALTPPPAGATP